MDRLVYDLIIPLQFQLYGEPVVKACVDQKCHYIDVSGETYVSVITHMYVTVIVSLVSVYGSTF